MQTEKVPVGQALHLRVGEIVEVRSEAEILATLDENGELDGLPFMPEMLTWCGQRLRVEKLALKLCDTIESTGMHRIRDAVHLEMSRCDGQAHGGCQAGCSLLEGGVAEADPVRGIGIGPNGGSGATLHAGDAHGCHAPAP